MTRIQSRRSTVGPVWWLVVLVAAPAAWGQGQALVWNGTEWVSPAPAEPGTPEGDLAMLREMIENGRNKTVVRAVERFLVSHGESPACEEAMNLAGQAMMNRGRYWEAYQWFERQISTYPNGAFFERALDREYRIADAFINGRKRRAMKIFRVPAEEDGIDMLLRIATHTPGTPLAQRALIRVADYHFSRAEYPEAIGAYEDIVKSHPLSEHRKYAMLQVARSYLLNFKGVAWDATPLLNARQRYTLFAQAYPRDAEKENVAGILDEIRLALAHKAYQTARFYERTHDPRAAAYYYHRVMQEYPETHWAHSARGRLDRLGPIPKPAEPFQPTALAPPVEVQEQGAAPEASPADTPPERDLPQPAPPAPEPTGPKPIPLEELSNRPEETKRP